MGIIACSHRSRMVGCQVAAAEDRIDGVGLRSCIGGQCRDVPSDSRSGRIKIMFIICTMVCGIDVHIHIALRRAVGVVAAVDVAAARIAGNGVVGVGIAISIIEHATINIDFDIARDLGSIVVVAETTTVNITVDGAFVEVHRRGFVAGAHLAQGRAAIDLAVDDCRSGIGRRCLPIGCTDVHRDITRSVRIVTIAAAVDVGAGRGADTNGAARDIKHDIARDGAGIVAAAINARKHLATIHIHRGISRGIRCGIGDTGLVAATEEFVHLAVSMAILINHGGAAIHGRSVAAAIDITITWG